MTDNIYLCETCGNMAEKIIDSGVNMVCCDKPMSLLVPGTVDASREKHVPVYTFDGNALTVKVGALLHPTEPTHYIEWIALVTSTGFSRRFLMPGDSPIAKFLLTSGEKPLRVFAYCNIHGLWVADID